MHGKQNLTKKWKSQIHDFFYFSFRWAKKSVGYSIKCKWLKIDSSSIQNLVRLVKSIIPRHLTTFYHIIQVVESSIFSDFFIYQKIRLNLWPMYKKNKFCNLLLKFYNRFSGEPGHFYKFKHDLMAWFIFHRKPTYVL